MSRVLQPYWLVLKNNVPIYAPEWTSLGRSNAHFATGFAVPVPNALVRNTLPAHACTRYIISFFQVHAFMAFSEFCVNILHHDDSNTAAWKINFGAVKITAQHKQTATNYHKQMFSLVSTSSSLLDTKMPVARLQFMPRLYP